MRVVFVDRDGVINRNRDDYVKSVDELEMIPGVPEAVRKLNVAGCQAVVISNQACVGKGLVSPEQLAEIDGRMAALVEAGGGRIAASYYCVHRYDEGCDCRKPQPGLILRASRELGVALADAVFVGDSVGDIQAGQSAGFGTVLVLSGKISARDAARLDPAPDYVAADLGEAVDWIISEAN